jgi:D-sedoheptulose 7-phosphate isomerase
MDHIQQLIERYPVLAETGGAIRAAFDALAECFENGGKLLVAGNGGSSADAEHMVGELMKGFVKKRRPPAAFTAALKAQGAGYDDFIARNIQGALPAIALSAHSSLLTASINDIGGDIIYAQQIYGYGKEADVFLGISTSGNAKNLVYAMATARTMNMKPIALSGGKGGALKTIADISIIVPETETFKVQELHLPVYHALCLSLEDRFFED